MRDESLYSTSTQKQSFDSMNYSDTRTTIMKIPQLDSLDSFDSEYDRDTLSQMTSSAGGDFMLGTLSKPSLAGARFSFNPAGGSYADTEHLYSGTPNALSDDDRFNVTYNRSGDIKISVIPENDVVGPPQKTSTINHNNNSNNQQSSIGKWFQSIFNIGRSSNAQSHNGYYSPPPPEHNSNINMKKINFQLKNDDQLVEQNGMFSIDGKTVDETTVIDDEDIINNSNLKDVDKYALEDELTAYMAELRLREKR